jgi:formylglycine-generating enzyme required for sulfatase activity
LKITDIGGFDPIQRLLNAPLSAIFRDILKDGSQGPEMVVIPAGRFRMGDIQGGGYKDEKPVHGVTMARSFAMGRFPVTFAEYDPFAEATERAPPNDAGWGRGNRPVINVSWEDALAYAEWLSEQTGKSYRLPTEAEWEYAARAGSDTGYWWGKEIGHNRANCAICGSEWDGKQTAPAGSFEPNPFGLYDTAGNVWEWVQDCWSESYERAPTDGSAWLSDDCGLRVMRGGSWHNGPQWVRSPHRSWFYPFWPSNDLGFRLAQDL